MTDVQIILVILGFLVVIGLLLHKLWKDLWTEVNSYDIKRRCNKDMPHTKEKDALR